MSKRFIREISYGDSTKRAQFCFPPSTKGDLPKCLLEFTYSVSGQVQKWHIFLSEYNLESSRFLYKSYTKKIIDSEFIERVFYIQ